MAKRKKKRARPQLSEATASIITLFVGAMLVLMAFVEGNAAWRGAHTILFGLFGCGSYVLGVAVCYLAVLMARGEDVRPAVFKLALGLSFASGTVIVFSDVDPTAMTVADMLVACYRNGCEAWLGGGALGAVFGGTLLALCGRPVANILLVLFTLCAGLYIFGVTPADLWQWLHNACGTVQEHGVAVYQDGKARHEERRAERLAAQAEREEEEAAAEEAAEEADEAEESRGHGMPGWLSSVLGRGRLPERDPAEQTDEEEDFAQSVVPPSTAEATAAAVRGYAAPINRSTIDIDLGPDHTPVTEGGSEPFEPIIVGPGGTFGMDALNHTGADAYPVAQQTPVVAGEPTEVAPEAFFDPAAEQPGEQAAPRVSAANAAAFRGEPDEDGWISITAEPVDAGDINSLVAAAMEKPQASEQAAAAAPVEEPAAPPTPAYEYPPVELFDPAKEDENDDAQNELKANAQKLVDTLESFGVKTRVLDISRGPAVTRYEVQPMAGVKISRITSLADDIALNLAVADVRMEAPIPGKPAVGIEVPNRKSTPVSIRSIFESQSFTHMTSPLTIALGKDIAGVAQVADLCRMPHLLIAGSTGSGKSVCVNSIIMSILFRSSPEDVKLILIDPKVVELAEYNGIPHLLMPVVTEPRKAAGALASAVGEMERRYHLFAENGVRDIKSFNKLAAENPALEKMPYIAIVIDELADLMMVVGKDVEDSICRIAQKARAAGMHLIVATQRPSVDVITGLIKANIPSRIAFAVSSQVDSRTILDGAGAEKLLGMGDMLFMPVGAPKPIRIQGTYVKDAEISRVLEFIKKNGVTQYDEAMIANMEKHTTQEKGNGKDESGSEEDDGDPMFKQAVEVVIDAGQASTSLLQRRCKLGYARAARIMDEMEQRGVIGPYEGAKPRAVLISRQQWLEMNINKETPAE
jgi:S-DNA-T family DNA segregation ATPase FtsK/SpoIIIE